MFLKNKITIGSALLVIALFLFSNNAFAVTYEEISNLELYQRITDKSDKGYLILDIREAIEYDQGHIPEAINIPLRELGIRFYELDKTKDIIVYCGYGLQSKVACQILINVDFKDVYNLTGGIETWSYALATKDQNISI